MITVEHLTKYYGDHLAVDDVSFAIDEGHVYGFLGPNGAGKSTTMNIMTGCLSASGGTVKIDGHDVFEEPKSSKRLIGYLPEHPPLYLNESPREYLKFVGEAKGLRGQVLQEQIDSVLEKTGTAAVQNRRISQLSKGYKQRVGIAQALLGDPKVVILDEPTVGLDPIQILEIRELIKSLGQSHTVIFSSHILSEVQAICDRILMIAHGKLVAFGAPEELQKQLTASNEVMLTTDLPAAETESLLQTLNQPVAVSAEEVAGRTVAHVKAEKGDLYALSADIFRVFAASGHVLYEMSLKKGNLEDMFLELTEAAPEQPEEAPEQQAAEQEDEP